MVLFSALESRPVLHEIVLAVFVIVTTPVTFMLLVRAALHRDAAESGAPMASGKPEIRIGDSAAGSTRFPARPG